MRLINNMKTKDLIRQLVKEALASNGSLDRPGAHHNYHAGDIGPEDFRRTGFTHEEDDGYEDSAFENDEQSIDDDTKELMMLLEQLPVEERLEAIEFFQRILLKQMEDEY